MTSLDIYREFILDHYKNPRNFGTLKNPTFTNKETNPLCGDNITVQVSIKNNKIKEIRFKSSGCAISQATASMISDYVKGKTIEEVEAMNSDTIMKIISVPITPGRIKCAMLALTTLKQGIKKYRSDSNGRS